MSLCYSETSDTHWLCSQYEPLCLAIKSLGSKDYLFLLPWHETSHSLQTGLFIILPAVSTYCKKSFGPRLQQSGFEPCLCHSFSRWPWAKYLTLMSLSLLICKIGMTKPNLLYYHVHVKLDNGMSKKLIQWGVNEMSSLSWPLSFWSPPVLFWKSPLSSESHLVIKTNSCFGPLESPPMEIPSTPRLDYSLGSCLDYLVLAILSPCLYSPKERNYAYYLLPTSFP